MRAIVDGANGFVGARLIHELLAAGSEVTALARGGDVTAKERVRAAVQASHFEASSDLDRLTVLDIGDLANGFGVGLRDVLRGHCREASAYWHVAASLRFRTEHRAELLSINVEGTRGCLAMVEELGEGRLPFVHVSTAYVCGTDQTSSVPERFFPEGEPSNFRNSYEESKRAAELVVRDYIEQGGRAVILRPSQLVGDSVTGHSATSFGIYDLITRGSLLARRYPRQTLRIEGDGEVTQNLVPIDLAVKAMISLDLEAALDLSEPIVHMVADRGIANRVIADVVERHLPLSVEFVDLEQADRKRGLPEQLLAAGMAFTGSYLREEVTFERRNLPALVADDDGMTPDDETLDRLVAHFLGDSQRHGFRQAV